MFLTLLGMVTLVGRVNKLRMNHGGQRQERQQQWQEQS